jgi:hypothetical protein
VKSTVIGLMLLLFLVGPASAATTVFPGGSLADLKALSPTLTFDVQTISGTLSLPSGSSASLRVNQLTIARSQPTGSSYFNLYGLNSPPLAALKSIKTFN